MLGQYVLYTALNTCCKYQGGPGRPQSSIIAPLLGTIFLFFSNFFRSVLGHALSGAFGRPRCPKVRFGGHLEADFGSQNGFFSDLGPKLQKCVLYWFLRYGLGVRHSKKRPKIVPNACQETVENEGVPKVRLFKIFDRFGPPFGDIWVLLRSIWAPFWMQKSLLCGVGAHQNASGIIL